MWWSWHNTTAVFSITVPAFGPERFGFSNAISMVVTTAFPTLAATSEAGVYYPIEGYRFARLAMGSVQAQPVTVAFWVKCNRTGLYGISLRSAALDRSCVLSYTVNVSGVWEYKTVTFPGCLDGTWNVTNISAAQLAFSLAAGSSMTAPATGVWYATNYVGAPGQVNAIAATSDYFQVTGLIILPGSVAPTAANSPYIVRPYDQELLLCSRYFQYNRVREPGFGQLGGATGPFVFFHTPLVPYRVTPTCSITSTSIGIELLPWTNGSTLTGCTVDASHATTTGFDYKITPTGGGIGSSGMWATIVAANAVRFDARL
jgi:hypothetical protein